MDGCNGPEGRLTFRYNDISIQLHFDTMTFRYDPKVSKCQKNLIEMPKYRNVRNGVSKCQNGVSKCQKYPNTQKCIEMSN